MSGNIIRHVVVRGQVQGVGYRAFVEHEALRVVVLDSLLYVNQVAGLLGRAQREWLSRFLPQVADRPVVLFVHHPPTDEDGDLLAVLRSVRYDTRGALIHEFIRRIDARFTAEGIEVPFPTRTVLLDDKRRGPAGS